MKRNYLVLLFVMGSVFCTAAVTTAAPAAAVGQAQSQPAGVTRLDTIVLESNNWEARGSLLKIEGGKYTYQTVYFKERGKKQIGPVESSAFWDIMKLMNAARFYELRDVYEIDPVKSGNWYQVTIKSNLGKKTVAFHSEDSSVPKQLKALVARIRGLVKT